MYVYIIKLINSNINLRVNNPRNKLYFNIGAGGIAKSLASSAKKVYKTKRKLLAVNVRLAVVDNEKSEENYLYIERAPQSIPEVFSRAYQRDKYIKIYIITSRMSLEHYNISRLFVLYYYITS